MFDIRVGVSYVDESWGSACKTGGNHSVSKIQPQNDHSQNGGRTSEGKVEGMHMIDSKWIEHTGFDEKMEMRELRC